MPTRFFRFRTDISMKFILDFIYRKRCLLCNDILTNKSQNICKQCEEEISPAYDIPIFPVIMRPKGKITSYIKTAASPFYYSGSIRDGILGLKFKKRTGNAKYFAGFLKSTLIHNDLEISDAIIPVPLSKKRFKKREYNQSELLANELCLITGIPVYNDVLFKIKDTKPNMTLKSAVERRANVKDAYIVKNPEKIKGLKLLLLDDIITTGATIKECAKLLHKAEAGEINCVSIARSR